MPMQSIIPTLRDRVLARAARLLIKSGTFRRHLATLDPTLDPDFLQAAGLIRNATDDEALFVRDLVSDSKSFAQLHQDLWVLHETRHKRNGYFVEFGATDGVNLSNTCLLEREFGWRGILAEPNPAWHAALRQNRKADIDLRCVAAVGIATPGHRKCSGPSAITTTEARLKPARNADTPVTVLIQGSSLTVWPPG